MTVISQMKHPNIVEYFEQGTNKGQFWFAMEYVSGPNLEEIAQTPSPAATRSPRPAGWRIRS